jgi:Na+/H+-dicarboxylate symporter
VFRKLTAWIRIAAVASVVVGWIGYNNTVDAAAATRLAGHFSLLSDVFLRLIKVIIAPLVFATVVSGIAGMGDAKVVGRIGGKALLLVHHGVAGLAAARHGARERAPAGQRALARAAGPGCRHEPEDRGPQPAGLRRAHGAGFVFLGPSVFRLMREVRDPLFVAFTTASSEAAYPS